ncbi:hypothetical protein D3C85_1791410 [compost metagenome]
MVDCVHFEAWIDLGYFKDSSPIAYWLFAFFLNAGLNILVITQAILDCRLIIAIRYFIMDAQKPLRGCLD